MIRSRAVNAIIWAVLAIALHVWPSGLKPVHAQGTRKDDIVFNSRGIPLAGASVHVCNMPATGAPCSPTALIYSDPLLTQALTNPITTDGMGNYFFYAAPGQYEIEISGPGITTKQIPNVILPSDPANPTFSSLSTSGGISAFALNLSGNLTVNGSTTVVGNLASGTLNLTNQGTPPGAASAGTVNLYTKLADKLLYYKDETGTETGPLVAGGAQTNQVNNWTAQQNFGNTTSKGPNPWYDITQYGGYIGPNYATPTTCSITSGSTALSCASALDFKNGNGILVYGAGPATGLATPQAPTVTPLWQTGTTSISYCVASVDYYGGMTPCGSAGSTSIGPAALGQNNYSISNRASVNDGTTVTITTTSAHNIPTTAYHTISYPQIEITGMSNASCNTDATITGVPSSTTFTISQQGIPDSTSCSWGSVGVRTEVEVKWDNHQSLPITNYTCSAGNSATITVPTLWTTVVGAFPSNKFNISGSSDTTYNSSFTIASWATVPTIQFSVPCSTSTDTGNFGGTMNFMQGHAVKVHLVYRCTGASCALPANASNYTLVGVAEGDDTYFLDKGYGVNPLSIDLGQYPSTAPTNAQNQYLDTTITAGGGTTSLTLAAPASTTVTSVKTWHDNVPNIYAACAAMPFFNGTIATSNGGTIYIPAPTAQAIAYYEFPIMGNLIGQVQWAGPNPSFNCANTELRVAAPFYQAGTIEWNGSITGIPGGHACVSVSYNAGGSSLPCFQGTAYPLFHFEPFLSGEQNLTNLEIQPGQNYQTGLLWDIEPAGNGTVGFWMNNVHSDGNDASFPVIIKAGFGFFWKNGGWAANQSEYAGGRSLYITSNCAGNVYQSLSATQFPYIFRSEDTYNYGTAEVDDCGTDVNFGGDWIIKYPLSENLKGTAWKFDSISGIRDFRIDDESVADSTGPGGPTFDFTNTRGGAEIVNPLCNGPLLEVSPSSTYTFKIVSRAGHFCPLIGIDPTNDATANYTYEALQNVTDYKANYTLQLLGANGKVTAGQMTNPAAAPTVTIGTSVCGGGFPVAGTYTYAVAAWDAVGGQTALSPASSPGTVLSGSNCPIIAQPTLPTGSVFWSAYAVTGPATGNVGDFIHGLGGCGPTHTPVQYTQIIDQQPFKCGSPPAINSTSLQALFQNGFFGNITASTESTSGQCFSSASPAACGAFINGFVTIPAGSSSIVVNTTAVTANSQISVTFDSTQGTNLGVTCNTTAQAAYISARTAGTSFTISVPSNFTTNPGCVGFSIKN
jgi:hypothetical protein